MARPDFRVGGTLLRCGKTERLAVMYCCLSVVTGRGGVSRLAPDERVAHVAHHVVVH